MFSWTERSFWNLFAVNTVYFLMPLVGGYLRAESFLQYKSDKHTFSNAEISEDYLYYESMQLFKMSFWSFFNLLDPDGQIYDAWNEQNDRINE